MSDVVNPVVTALDDYDLDAFVECYTQDATIGDGREQIRARGHNEFRAHERHVAIYLVVDDVIARERIVA